MFWKETSGKKQFPETKFLKVSFRGHFTNLSSFVKQGKPNIWHSSFFLALSIATEPVVIETLQFIYVYLCDTYKDMNVLWCCQLLFFFFFRNIHIKKLSTGGILCDLTYHLICCITHPHTPYIQSPRHYQNVTFRETHP